MQEPNEGLAVSAPEASGYDFQASGVVETLEGVEQIHRRAHHG